MAKKQNVRYFPTSIQLNDMRICHHNSLAYVIVPTGSNKFWISKYSLNDVYHQIYLTENNQRVLFTQYEADKKIMELYSYHAKRFKK